jgi:predicted ester cyclase
LARTHEGVFFGIEPTGQRVEMTGIVLWRVVEGQLAERWAVLDYDTLLRSLSSTA